jgi:hypothetical protein
MLRDLHAGDTNMFPRAYLYFLLVLATCVAGFWQSFFANPLENHLPHLVHGIFATLWLVLLVAQAWLANARKLAIHRTSGKLAYVLAPALFISGWVVLFIMLAQSDHFPPGIRPKLALYDLVSLGLFGWLFVMAIWRRHDVQQHARYMSATALVLLPPAIPRLIFNHWPGAMSFDASLHVATVIPEFALVLLIINDVRLRQRQLAFPITLIGFLALHIGLGVIPGTVLWQTVTAWPSTLLQ